MQKIFIKGLLPVTVIGAAVILISTTGCEKQGRPSVDLPLLTTNVPTDITAISATCGGSVTSEGGEDTWKRGISWDTTSSPVSYSFGTFNGVSGTDTFSFPMEGLKPLTKYYVRAYAQNSAGVAYGNEVSFSTPDLVIGGSVKHGIVFDIDTTGLHGLVCAPVDQGEVSWSNGNYVVTGAVALDNGYFNTDFILNAQGSGNYAALICVNYGEWSYSSPNGYIWYLPSRDELNKLYHQKNVIGGFSDGDYWSSTEANTTKAWLKNFSDGKETASDKAIAHHVRAISTF